MTASTTIARVRLLGDEFANIPDERLEMYIEDASLEVSSLDISESHKEKLARYLAAHLAVLSITQNQSVIREKLDVIEREYSDPNKNNGIFSTKYGQEYQRLLDDWTEQSKKKKGLNLMVI